MTTIWIIHAITGSNAQTGLVKSLGDDVFGTFSQVVVRTLLSVFMIRVTDFLPATFLPSRACEVRKRFLLVS
jgi:hypothetical protein